MASSSSEPKGIITDWNEDDVQLFLSHLGFPQYSGQIKGWHYAFTWRLLPLDSWTALVTEHNISGDILCIIGHEELKEFGITTIGQRLTILKAIYQTKLAHKIPIEPDHYVPPCA